MSDKLNIRCTDDNWEFSSYFKYTILDAGNIRKAKNIIDAVTYADRGFYVLCWAFNSCGNYKVYACGRTILETLESYNGGPLCCSAESLYNFEKNNCYTPVYIFPATHSLFKKVQAVKAQKFIEYPCTQFYCHTKRGIALENHNNNKAISPFLKNIRRFLRDECRKELEALSTQLCVTSDIDLARCLKTNIRNIRNIRQSGSLCTLTELYKKAGITGGRANQGGYSREYRCNNLGMGTACQPYGQVGSPCHSR